MTLKEHRLSFYIVVIGVVTLAAMTGVVSADGDTEVTVEPENENVTTGESQTFDIVVNNATDDVQGFEFVIELSDGSAAEITDISTDIPEDESILETNYTADNDAVSVEALAPATDRRFESDSPTILTVTVQGQSVGQTDIDISPFNGAITIADKNVKAYNVTNVNSASLDVEESDTPFIPGATGPATDTTGNGKLNDVNGDGQFTPQDVTFLFNNRDADAITNNAAQFDFNDLGDGFTPADVTRLFNILVS